MEQDKEYITWSDFEKVEIRVGTIISAEVFAEARNPAYKIVIDFGEFGTRKTSAQVTRLYEPEALIGKQVTAVINFPPKQIANIQSECLLLGAVDGKDVTLLTTDKPVKNGLRIG
ncbi:tRNA-binding protein [Crocinitomicaceae bacterium CZZ-1]|uniref:tRNA-binding protein n=1 Tax=Taishania pollutisoli TaxID=2766479 RepID=A0A8J6TTD9_9FLAO|nr:tRNA-binding protein [Taishania pollutisoli]MBC9812684.1 tRNA-binding protein [Taishania pollutisoli]MBX2949160.1 tRNA-binding protein [Crocinitomicaceae bacterium]NGF75908.1 tRNA-binding protein [Fluviicola sp. SGL-29]